MLVPTLAAAAIMLAPAAHAQDAPVDREALDLARTILDHGASLYDAKDPEVMAATYTDDAEITIVSKKSAELRTETKRGRAEIEEVYRGLFKNAGTIHSKNTVEYARRLDPEMLLIAGVFQPNSDSLRVPFVQVRIKRGEKWLMHSLRIFLIDKQ
jgi:hypothetical protein